MKKILFAAVLMCAAFSANAQFSLTGEINATTDVYSLTHSKNDGAAEEPVIYHNVFDKYNFSDMKFAFKYDSDIFGYAITLRPFYNIIPSKSGGSVIADGYKYWAIFDDLYGYAQIKNIARLQVGKFDNRVGNLHNSIIDEWKNGPLWIKDNDAVSSVLGSVAVMESDALRHILLSFNAGPVVIEYSPVAELADSEVIKNAYGQDAVDGKFTEGGMIQFIKSNVAWTSNFDKFASTFRVSTQPLVKDMLKFSATYGLVWAKESRSETMGKDPSNKAEFLNRYGVIVDAMLPFGLNVSLGYSGFFINSSQPQYNSVVRDLSQAIDLRASYNGFENLLLETHHKVAFGNNFGTMPYQGADETKKYVYDAFTNLVSYWGGIGATYDFREDMGVSFVFLTQYNKVWTVQNGDQKCAEDVKFTIKPEYVYHITKNTSIKAGLRLDIDKIDLTNRDGNTYKDGAGTVGKGVKTTLAVPLSLKVSF